MKTKTIHSVLAAAVCAALLGLAACNQDPPMKDPAVYGGVPHGAVLVAESPSIEAPLTFLAPSGGDVLYFGNDKLLARFQVNRSEKVELNGYTVGKVKESTEVTAAGKVVYKSDTRLIKNRFYFLSAENK